MKTGAPEALSPALLERVLTGLGFASRPEPDWQGLQQLYAAWCGRVPFDNVRKLIHVRSREPGALPGDTPADFFEAWLRHGTGGTCWAGNGALHTLLRALDFEAERALATMLVAPNVPPNHGSVVVTCERRRYLVDASILHGEPLELEQDASTAIEHPAWGVQCSARAGQWVIHWRPLHRADGVDCRLEALQVGQQIFHERYEESRGWSPFNFSVYARTNRNGAVLGTAFGQRVEIDAGGEFRQRALALRARTQFLIEELDMDPALIERLPPDLPTPPPPGSASAGRAESR